MRAVGIFDTVDKGSVLLDIDLPIATLTPSASGTIWGGVLGAETVVIVQGDGTQGAKDWHNASAPILSIVVQGAWEIEASDGERRVLEAGALLLVCDRYGKGHRSLVVGAGCTTIGVRLSQTACETLKGHCQADLPSTVVWPC